MREVLIAAHSPDPNVTTAPTAARQHSKCHSMISAATHVPVAAVAPHTRASLNAHKQTRLYRVRYSVVIVRAALRLVITTPQPPRMTHRSTLRQRTRTRSRSYRSYSFHSPLMHRPMHRLH